MWVDMDIVFIEIQEWILLKNKIITPIIELDDPENFELSQVHKCKSILGKITQISFDKKNV